MIRRVDATFSRERHRLRAQRKLDDLELVRNGFMSQDDFMRKWRA